MRYRATTTLLSLVTLAACRGEPEPEPSKCDLDALTELGHTLASLSFVEQAERVWPGIMAACDDEVPTPLVNYFDPETLGWVLERGRSPWTLVLQRRACPRFNQIIRAHEDAPRDTRALTIFEECDFSRYEVLAAEEVAGSSSAIMTWATHQWLLDQGLDTRVAAPVTRALFARDQIDMWLIEIEDDLRAPKAHGVPFPGGMPIYVTREQVSFAGRQDFAIEDGRLTSPWFGERMTEEAERTLASAERGESDAVLLVVGDARAEMKVVTAVLYAGIWVGFERFGLFVAPEAFVPTYIPVALVPPDELSDTVELDPTQTPMLMSVELTPDGLTLGRGWNDRSKLQAHALDELAAVASFAEVTRRADPNARVVVISAERGVTLDQTLAVIEAARGPRCSDSEAECVLPDVLLRSQGAHRYPKRLD